MFSPRRISGFEGLRRRIVDEMLEGVWREMEERGVVEVREILQKGSLRNVVESVFGRCVCLEGEELGLMVKEGYELISKFNWEDYFPLGFLDFCGEGEGVISWREVQDSDIPNLPYLQAIVKEVLRLHPPGPLLSWARLAIHDVHVGKFFVPAGTMAMVNMWAITHEGSIWKNPWTFRPERFMEEEVSIMGSDLRLAPFGSGRRVCPGKALGLATVHFWLARLLHQFTWLPVPSHSVIDLSECLRLSLEMKKPLACCVVRRKSAAII
ncbi:hypothetical protein HHK36_007574 [Tetracentron sinense]|uniref:Cytochrome P450 n=1 Tax=Tetracentron sinense TaxID=13715 RepID=A0A835DQ92_TETSI|nr:hypothetical protein HHK36_007574 [Tetracentron sinense]